MKLPTWVDLRESHCTSRYSSRKIPNEPNPHYEEAACRRYNCSTYTGHAAFRLIFLKDVLKDPTNKTLVRKGRFIWCRDLRYEGKSTSGLRQISFTVDQGSKRFTVAENNMLCIPASAYVNNNRFFRTPDKTFIPFSSVFSYNNTLHMMSSGTDLEQSGLKDRMRQDNPYRPGTLVSPRLGYFYPDQQVSREILTADDKNAAEIEHPCGIILGPSLVNGDYSGREFYRVRFAHTTYERVHPIQMEIINEV